MNPPLLIYDNDCTFCCYWVARWKHLTAGRIEYVGGKSLSQYVGEQFPSIPTSALESAVQFVDSDGEIFSGAEAVFRALSYAPYWGWMLWMYQKIPGFAPLTEWVYGFVARNRPIFSALTRWLWGPALERPTYFLSRWMFLRLLGIVYLIAFLSLWVQLDGLVGSNGILPATEYFNRVSERIGPERYRLLPTLFWLYPSDGFAHVLCAGGTLLSVLLVVGVIPIPALVGLWAFYLSLVLIGQDFLSFQWDILLLETGFLAIFFAPGTIPPRLSKESPPSPTVLWLLRWLLFRLMFASGFVKIASDETWRNLTALNYHYETQPLPTALGWYVHQLPEWFQKLSVIGMFGIELVIPFFIFAPRRVRFCAGYALIALQLLIIATGNYCFFNLLTIALCLLLFDDIMLRRFRWQRLFRRENRVEEHTPTEQLTTVPLYRTVLIGLLTVLILTVSGIRMGAMVLQRGTLPPLAQRVLRWVGPFYIVNSYGLFANMTESRPEIVVEGSNDGRTWHQYEFKWKPGNLKRPPRWVAPHQPRLDWQMWFAVLGGNYQNTPWFLNFMGSLLKGSAEVLALLEQNPFPEKPPRYVRAILYDYRFTELETKSSDGNWWRREQIGLYCPAISLRR